MTRQQRQDIRDSIRMITDIDDEEGLPAEGLIEPENSPFGHLAAIQQQRLMRPQHMLFDLPFDPL